MLESQRVRERQKGAERRNLETLSLYKSVVKPSQCPRGLRAGSPPTFSPLSQTHVAIVIMTRGVGRRVYCWQLSEEQKWSDDKKVRSQDKSLWNVSPSSATLSLGVYPGPISLSLCSSTFSCPDVVALQLVELVERGV